MSTSKTTFIGGPFDGETIDTSFGVGALACIDLVRHDVVHRYAHHCLADADGRVVSAFVHIEWSRERATAVLDAMMGEAGR